MSEYIFELDSLKLVYEPMQREKIVRCCDCKQMRDWTTEEVLASYSEEELADGWCMFFRIGTYNDFFCSWGVEDERKAKTNMA